MPLKRSQHVNNFQQVRLKCYISYFEVLRTESFSVNTDLNVRIDS